VTRLPGVQELDPALVEQVSRYQEGDHLLAEQELGRPRVDLGDGVPAARVIPADARGEGVDVRMPSQVRGCGVNRGDHARAQIVVTGASARSSETVCHAARQSWPSNWRRWRKNGRRSFGTVNVQRKTTSEEGGGHATLSTLWVSGKDSDDAPAGPRDPSERVDQARASPASRPPLRNDAHSASG
jgi:hypothetical protein